VKIEYLQQPGLTFLKMVPKDSSGSTETNGDAHSAGRGNLKPKRRTSSSGSASLTEEELDASLRAIDDISKILRFALGYISEIDEVKKVFDLNIEQERQIEKYKDTVNYLAFRKNEEMARLMKENETYEANLQQFELGRKELERERASIDGKRIAMKSDMQKEKEEEIQVVKRDVSEKATAKLERIRNKFEEKIKAMEMEKKELKDANKALEEEKAQAQSKLNEQREDFELDKRAVQTYTKKLESDLRQAKALPLLSPQPPQF
jgi:DNA repair exonuclease SbcCD ATPase subunit